VSGAGGIRAGRAYVELYADGSQLNAGLKRAQERLRAFSSALRNVGASMVMTGAAMFTPFVLSVKKFMDAAKEGKLAGADLGKSISLHQAVRTTSASIDELEIAVGASLTPALVVMAGWLRSVVGSFTDWARANPGTVTAIALIAGGVVSLGAGLLGLGAAVNIASWAFGGLAAAASAAFGVIAGTVSAVLSPISLVAAALIGLGYVLATKTEAGRQSLSYLGQGFKTLADDGIAAWGGITDAMATGDMGLAAEIGLTAVKLVFQRAWSSLKNLTIGFLVDINKAFLEAGTSIALGWTTAMGFIGQTIILVGRDAKHIGATVGSVFDVMVARFNETIGLVPEGTAQHVSDAAGQRTVGADNSADLASKQLKDDITKRMSDIRAQSSDMAKELDAGLAGFVDENAATVAALRAQLDALRASAAAGRKKLDERMKAKGDQATAAAAAVTGRPPKGDVFGTFSSAATYGIGIGSTAADRTANAAEKSAKELTAIREKICTGQAATFAP